MPGASPGIALLNDPVALRAFDGEPGHGDCGAATLRRDAGKDRHRWTAAMAALPVSLYPRTDGIAAPEHLDRSIVDLLFFPTGGNRRRPGLRPSRWCCGGCAAACTRGRQRADGYPLRLLTLDQLGRAATLICALELERQKNPGKLGDWPFEIGLWVGQGATPNRMGRKGDNNPDSARAKTIAYKNDDRKPSPIPLEECPWCGTKFTRNSFQLVPNADEPADLRVLCANRNCAFTRDRALPILSVDEPMYRRLPCFIIATVDKFAAMPWTGEVGLFFGGAERYDQHGFYGPCTPGRGSRLEQPLPPPDLVIGTGHYFGPSRHHGGPV